ncbi:hypothetical protein HDV04_005726 [Boothiomyces sp. JEL0838]|nr:hypothetical protein HDV04_005726 [Boothiomyces sp. JEL0838]
MYSILVLLCSIVSAQLIFEENFDSLESLDSQSFKIKTSGTAKASLISSANGNKAMKLDIESNGAAFLVPNDFSPENGDFFGRFRIQTNFPNDPNFAHWINVQFTGKGAPDLVRPVGGQLVNNLNSFGIGADAGPTGDWTDFDPNVPATPSTRCIEFQVNASGNFINTFFDAEDQPSLTASKTKHSIHSGNKDAPFILPKANAIQFGWQVFQPNSGRFTVMIDDIAIGTDRIGCN